MKKRKSTWSDLGPFSQLLISSFVLVAAGGGVVAVLGATGCLPSRPPSESSGMTAKSMGVQTDEQTTKPFILSQHPESR